jgi:UDP-N-acetylmuramate--alanine ligase
LREENLESDAASCAPAQQRQHSGDMSAEIDLGKIKGPIHFVGIGGIGMSGIARLLLAQKRPVSGSDQSESEITQELAALGAKIYIGHQESNVQNAGALVVSTAINSSNPEMVFAKNANLPIWHRSDLLYHIGRLGKLIAVSGTHGKTTTTGMIGQVFLDAGLEPSIVVGGIFDRIGSNAIAGDGQYFIAEADESDRTHANVVSSIAIVTNIEADHLENYPGGVSQIRDIMTSFAKNAEDAVVICVADLGCRTILRTLEASGKRCLTYGRHGQEYAAMYSYESLPGCAFDVYHGDEKLGTVELSVPGEHNKQNALAAVVTGLAAGIAFPVIAEALASFKGVDRRFQIIGEENDILVVDDYAHHPTEVKAVLQAAKQYIAQLKNKTGVHKRLVAVFQPHQPGRLRDFWDEFSTSLKDADVALIADIYVARGGNIEGIDSKRFTSCLDHADAHYLPGPGAELAELVLKYVHPNDLVLTIGAGDITKLGPKLLAALKKADTKNGSPK